MPFSFLEDNRTCAGMWEDYRSHRDQVMSQLLRGAPRGALAILGSGNCNDIDLQSLLAFYGQVHLFDFDMDALAFAVLRQNCPGHPRLYSHAPRDLSGILEVASQWRNQLEHSAHDVRLLLEQAAAGPGLGRVPSFDVVASTTVLTQLLSLALLAPGERHAAYPEMVRAIRGAHLRLMLNLLRPGGIGVLITDLVSTDTLPELATADVSELPRLAEAAVNARNFFTGVNPAVILKELEDPAQLGAHVGRVQLVKPWKWTLGERAYLVYAAKFQRSA